MVNSAFFAFLHFAAVFGIVATLAGEWLLLGRELTLAQARRIQICDRWYGVCATVVLVVGFLRVLHFEKGQAFYFGNPFFLLKIALFTVVGLLSIYPTVRFIQWGRATRLGQVPVVDDAQCTRLRTLIGIELVALLAIALCASLMARGVGS